MVVHNPGSSAVNDNLFILNALERRRVGAPPAGEPDDHAALSERLVAQHRVEGGKLAPRGA